MDEQMMRWTTMLNQARAFAEVDPHDALGRVDEVLREVDALAARDPSRAAALRDIQHRARKLRAVFANAYQRFQAAAVQRSVAYRARIGREIEQA